MDTAVKDDLDATLISIQENVWTKAFDWKVGQTEKHKVTGTVWSYERKQAHRMKQV